MATTIIKGTVDGGRRIGRKLGFPTANIRAGEHIEAADGVYAAEVRDGANRYRGMANLGHRPSVSGQSDQRMLEVNLFDYEGDLYGKTLEVRLLRYFREERQFATLEELRRQIAADRKEIEEYFKTI